MRIIGVIAVLVVIGAIIISSSGSNSKKNTSTASADTPAQAVDTGRMSGSEFDDLTLFTGRFKDEAATFIAGVAGKCGTLAAAAELAAASDCYSEAYDGVDDKAAGAYSVYTDLIGSTAKSCKRSMRRLRSALDSYTSALKVVEKLGENLVQGEALGVAAAKDAVSKSTRFDKRRRSASRACSPA